MPYFFNQNINVLYIHIPKTGGTSIEYYFSNKYNIPLTVKSLYIYTANNSILPEHNNVSLQHQTYSTLYKYRNLLNIQFDNTLKIIASVRNPYHRIISDLLWWKLIDENTSPSKVYNIIQEYIHKKCYDNHNIPQYTFIIDENNKIPANISIIQTETLNDDMIKLGFTDFNIHANKSDINKDINYYKKYLNNKSIKLINEFYKKDFLYFKYDMIV